MTVLKSDRTMKQSNRVGEDLEAGLCQSILINFLQDSASAAAFTDALTPFKVLTE